MEFISERTDILLTAAKMSKNFRLLQISSYKFAFAMYPNVNFNSNANNSYICNDNNLEL